ncbi:MAG: hypothetical protein L6R37_000468 [Teloschistes peruensis]|nr:MAG: hypothetical protein L6R37_000468 [Teloschistes peruensis]
MNDVEMPDAGSSVAPKTKGVSKTAKAGGAADDSKKRFEVKKWNAVALHRMSSKPTVGYKRRMYGSLGNLQPCLPLPLHLPLAKDASSLPVGQPRLGIPEVWTMIRYRMTSHEIEFDDNLEDGSRNNRMRI